MSWSAPFRADPEQGLVVGTLLSPVRGRASEYCYIAAVQDTLMDNG